jgi:hypothetical protein
LVTFATLGVTRCDDVTTTLTQAPASQEFLERF